MASEHLSGIVFGNAVSLGAAVDTIHHAIKDAGLGLASKSRELSGLNEHYEYTCEFAKAGRPRERNSRESDGLLFGSQHRARLLTV